jgi:hypothetical protein
MTKEELKNYTRGIAYNALRFERGQINSEELLSFLRISCGKEAYEEAEEEMEVLDARLKALAKASPEK